MKDIGLKTFEYFNRILINKWLQFIMEKKIEYSKIYVKNNIY